MRKERSSLKERFVGGLLEVIRRLQMMQVVGMASNASKRGRRGRRMVLVTSRSSRNSRRMTSRINKRMKKRQNNLGMILMPMLINGQWDMLASVVKNQIILDQEESLVHELSSGSRSRRKRSDSEASRLLLKRQLVGNIKSLNQLSIPNK